jgi:hypothetical protein
MPMSKENKLRISRKNSNLFMRQYQRMSQQYLKIITTWCLSLLIMNCVYIAFSFYKFDNDSIENISDSNRSSCIAIGVLLHYFLLVSFFFSLSITVLQYYIIYKCFKIIRFVYLKAFVFSFGKIKQNSENIFRCALTLKCIL